jgi:MFS family permease
MLARGQQGCAVWQALAGHTAPVILVDSSGAARKATLLASLYLAQGLPYGFFSLALPVLLRERGVSLSAIGLLGLLALPWAFKFLWAPLLDQRGSRRAWLLGLQLAAVVGALVLAALDGANFGVLFVAAFAFNLVAASQDVVTDGLAVRLLDARERGIGNGLQVGAYRLGMILGGGALLWLFARAGWTAMCLALAALLALTVLPVLSMPRGLAQPAGAPIPLGQWAGAWLRRARQPALLAMAGLVFCYRFGDQMLSSLLGPFLLDTGLSLETIALMKGAVGSATSLAGAAIGGLFVWRVGRRRALLVSGLAQAACFGLYIAAAQEAGGVALLWVATVAEGVIGTMATVALFTLMMDAADPDHAGTDYTLLASTVVLVGSLAGIMAAALADALGYVVVFVLATALAIAGCLFVVWWLDHRPASGRVTEAWGQPARRGAAW